MVEVAEFKSGFVEGKVPMGVELDIDKINNPKEI